MLKKFLSFILAGVLPATPSLHANVKVHFEGDITKTILYALPSWIERAPMDEAVWVVKVDKRKPISPLGVPILLGGVLGGVIGLQIGKLEGEPGLGVLGGSGIGLVGLGFPLAFLPWWYGVSYSLDIRNLNTGWGGVEKLRSYGPGGGGLCGLGNEAQMLKKGDEKLAQKIADFFEEYNKDNAPPQIVLYSPFDQKEYTTSVEKVTMRVSVNDDVQLSRVVILKDRTTYQNYSVAGGNRFSKSLDIPLELGYNKFQVVAIDWMNKTSYSQETTIFRSKEGGAPPAGLNPRSLP